ncbi:hypothetical protein QTP88_012733 [Uroleucon formosanum]
MEPFEFELFDGILWSVVGGDGVEAVEATVYSKEVSVQTLETADEELLLTPEPPDCWENKKVKYFTEVYS